MNTKIKIGLGRLLLAPFVWLALLSAAPTAQASSLTDPDGVYQWSVTSRPPDADRREGRAFLWIPETCSRLRGVVIGQTNMLEEPIFASDIFRKELAAADLGLVFISPIQCGIYHFEPNEAAWLEDILVRLAQESGYEELATIPTAFIGHSAMAMWPYMASAIWKDRAIAGVSLKGAWADRSKNWGSDFVGKNLAGIPFMLLDGEYEDADGRAMRSRGFCNAYPDVPFSMCAEAGAGHFDWSDELCAYLGMYFRKAALARVPEIGGALKPVDPKTSGWLMRRWNRVGDRVADTPAPVASYLGDRQEAYWYFDKEMVDATLALQERFRNLPTPLIGYQMNGEILPQHPREHLQILIPYRPIDSKNGLRFKFEPCWHEIVEAGRLADWTLLPAGAKAPHPKSTEGLFIQRINGGGVSVGENRWEARPNRFTNLNANSWDICFQAIWPGDKAFRRSVQQSRLRVYPPKQPTGIKRYFVREGAAVVNPISGALTTLPLPPRARKGHVITVVEYTWGGKAVEKEVPYAELATKKQKPDRIAEFAAKGVNGLSDRLLMYWNTHAKDVFVRDQAIVSVGGARADVPTVMFDGNRSHVTAYKRPRLEDIPPRFEDPRGFLLEPKDGSAKTWAPYGKMGTMINSLNNENLSLATQAAERGFALGNDPAYLDMARQSLLTYLAGIEARNVATDLDHGHMQTLFGMQSMETIHDEPLKRCCKLYSLLKPILTADEAALCQRALRKWAEVQIANGVADNNWDMMQLNNILDIAIVLEPNSAYSDGRGREYYLDVVMNRSFVRNLSVKALADVGFDKETGIWWECPGYSQVTLKDFARFADKIKEVANIDLFKEIPVLKKAFAADYEYLFPDGMIIGFGDTHPSALDPLITRYGKREPSPFFYAPNASWLISRSGMDRYNDVAFALNGALGNHQHANGISMELYAKGYRIAPDAGIGWTLYSGQDYQEYYSRYMAHNTVMVSSRSDHSPMKCYHPFKLVSHTDTSATVSFREPATGADQLRTTSYIKDKEGAYFIDVFRSRVVDEEKQWHDYYYHNLGDSLTLNGKVAPTDMIAFRESGIYGLSYITDKYVRQGKGDLEAIFDWSRPEGLVRVRVFMNDATDRFFIKAIAPATEGLSRVKEPNYNITRESRTPVLVVRQMGEAWDRPFVAVIDPSDTVKSVQFTEKEIRITRASGRVDIHPMPTEGTK